MALTRLEGAVGGGRLARAVAGAERVATCADLEREAPVAPQLGLLRVEHRVGARLDGVVEHELALGDRLALVVDELAFDPRALLALAEVEGRGAPAGDLAPPVEAHGVAVAGGDGDLEPRRHRHLHLAAGPGLPLPGRAVAVAPEDGRAREGLAVEEAGHEQARGVGVRGAR